MSDLWRTVAELALELHPDRLAVVIMKLGELKSPEDFDKVKTSFGPGVDSELVQRLEDDWKATPSLSPLELAAALRGAAGTAVLTEKRETVEMVWTGPLTGLVASRHTERVLLEVISVAKRRLFLVSFVAYDVDVIIKALQDAIGRNVEIDLLLESSRSHGGKVDIDSISTFLRRVPTINIYAWTKTSKREGYGAVHAKCAVADEKVAFITSANLTMAAMEKNMELGVLIRGGNLPKTLHRHLEALITTETIERV